MITSNVLLNVTPWVATVEVTPGGGFGLIGLILLVGFVTYCVCKDASLPYWYKIALHEWNSNLEKRTRSHEEISDNLKEKVFAVVIRTKGGQVSDLESVLIQSLIELGCRVVSLPTALSQELHKGEFKVLEIADFILVGTAWQICDTSMGERHNNITRYHLDFKVFPGRENMILAAHNIMYGKEEWLIMGVLESINSAVMTYPNNPKDVEKASS